MPVAANIMTQREYDKNNDEIARLRDIERPKVLAAVQDARGFGDFSENAELDAASEELAKIDSRISELEQILKSATVVEADDSMVSIGSTVEVEDERGRRQRFTIVGSTQTNSLNHEISNESPAGAAMMGHVEGDTVTFVTPTGRQRTLTIVAISKGLAQ